ncbi:MAG TPA: GNAT family N-acetyltransferase [Polyangiaceae bacterium]|jgi:GNAT superfamily N-acetyltransferase|nr:GNAT family N-acetyltransferase [Polyangiaceae bacterium]
MTATAADFELFAACFTSNGTLRGSGDVRWQFGENPTAELWADFALATATERLAAIYAVMPLRVRFGGRVLLAAQSVDTITDTAFRGRGLFLKLASECYARAERAGATCVFGFPNGSSAHGFFEKLDWAPLDPVPFIIRPLRTRYVAQRLKIESRLVPDARIPVFSPRPSVNHRLVTIDPKDERAAAVWNEFASDVGIAVERNTDYLRWRLSRPGAAYRAFGVEDGDHQLVAYGVHRFTEKHGGRVGYVMELLHRPEEPRAGAVVLGAILRALQSEGADVALAWNLAHSRNHRVFRRAGFVPFPERLRPIELHFGARSFEHPPNVAVADRKSWYLSYLDSDTV